jgi:hypothetical protein
MKNAGLKFSLRAKVKNEGNNTGTLPGVAAFLINYGMLQQKLSFTIQQLLHCSDFGLRIKQLNP